MYTEEIALTQLRLRRAEELFYGREPKAPQLLLQLLCRNQPLHKLHDLLSDADIGNLNAVDSRMKERFEGDSPVAFGRRTYYSYTYPGYPGYHQLPKIKGSVSVLPRYQLTGQAEFVTDQPFPTSKYLYERSPSDFVFTLNLPKAPPLSQSNSKYQSALQRRLEEELSLLQRDGASCNLRTWLAVLNAQLCNLQALSNATTYTPPAKN